MEAITKEAHGFSSSKRKTFIIKLGKNIQETGCSGGNKAYRTKHKKTEVISKSSAGI